MEYRQQEWRREGKTLRIRQQWVPLSRISPFLIKAVTIAEDDKFYQHEGFDFEAMQQALEKDIKAGKFKAGGSTISQQLAKNLYLTPSKNPVRKVKEAVLTWRLERVLSKKRIMELYLNVVEWGEGIFGAEMAARTWYGKAAAALGPEEAARLAVVLPNPKKYNPRSSSKYVANRSRIVYNIMVRRGIVIPVYEEIMTPAPGEPSPEPPPVPTAREQEGSAADWIDPPPEVTP
jgi:monofunctional biosynthetic peptidoglycan transglycosylase